MQWHSLYTLYHYYLVRVCVCDSLNVLFSFLFFFLFLFSFVAIENDMYMQNETAAAYPFHLENPIAALRTPNTKLLLSVCIAHISGIRCIVSAHFQWHTRSKDTSMRIRRRAWRVVQIWKWVRYCNTAPIYSSSTRPAQLIREKELLWFWCWFFKTGFTKWIFKNSLWSDDKCTAMDNHR